jgi:hypothetical protein
LVEQGGIPRGRLVRLKAWLMDFSRENLVFHRFFSISRGENVVFRREIAKIVSLKLFSLDKRVGFAIIESEKPMSFR